MDIDESKYPKPKELKHPVITRDKLLEQIMEHYRARSRVTSNLAADITNNLQSKVKYLSVLEPFGWWNYTPEIPELMATDLYSWYTAYNTVMPALRPLGVEDIYNDQAKVFTKAMELFKLNMGFTKSDPESGNNRLYSVNC